jgi:hypothetical protein
MIKRNSKFGHELTCDICGKGEKFDYFDHALEYKKDLGWISEKYNGEWQDICPECQEVT